MKEGKEGSEDTMVPIADDPAYQSPEGFQRFRGAFGMTLDQWNDVAWFCSAVGDGGDLEPVGGWWLRDDSVDDAGHWLDVKATGNRIAVALGQWQRISESERRVALASLATLRHAVANYTAVAAYPSDVEIFSSEKTFSPTDMQSALRELTIRQRHTLRGRIPRGENGSSKRKISD